VSGQNSEAGRALFEGQCATCHGADARGGELGPAIVMRIPQRSDEELATLIHQGLPNRGMPGATLGSQQTGELIAFLRSLRAQRRPPAPPVRLKVELAGGRTLEGLVLNQSLQDLELRTDDQRIHLLRPAGDGRHREVTSQVDWPSYNGDAGGNRYTRLDQIKKENVARLAPKWIFTAEGVPRMETTPVVVEGVMYVTSGNECWALDAGSGRQIWHFQRPRTRGLVGNAAGASTAAWHGPASAFSW